LRAPDGFFSCVLSIIDSEEAGMIDPFVDFAVESLGA